MTLAEHLEAALADESKDGVVGYLAESALDQLRADTCPGSLDVPARDFARKAISAASWKIRFYLH
jgi:hypothetical protein